MKQIIKAVYENGCFRPLEPQKIQLDEGQIVWLTIIKVEKDKQDEIPEEKNNQD